MSKKLKKVLGTAIVVSGFAFAGLSIFAKKKKANSVYEDDKEEKNPLEGKKVIFVEDENDKRNADGIRGHLEKIGISKHKSSFYEKYTKRGIDLFLSFGGLVVLSPVMGAIALAIKVEDPGPVLFTQKRIGQNKQYFKLHKFRSMKMSTPHDVPTHMLDNPDQYITKVGKFIREHSLDELPQIWDIFIGNMSVIGPRPGLWNQDVLTAERDKYGANDIKPGLTGWAQINGRDEIEIPEKAKLDGEYAKKIGLVMDAKVFLRSLHVFGGDDSVVEGGTGAIKRQITESAITVDDIKVSIITPAYNSGKYIDETIQSVINQTHKNWEMIIVHDCSSDDTQLIVKEYASKDKRIKLISNKENYGVAISRNIGLKKAKGKYVAFIDSDDLWDKEKLKKQLVFMENNTIYFSFSSYQKFDSNSGKKEKVINVPLVITANEILENTIIGCLTVMINREKIGDFYMPNLNHMEDNATWYSILKKGYNAYGIQEILAYYREGTASLTSSKAKAALQQWRVYRDYFHFTVMQSVTYFVKWGYHAVIKHF